MTLPRPPLKLTRPNAMAAKAVNWKGVPAEGGFPVAVVPASIAPARPYSRPARTQALNSAPRTGTPESRVASRSPPRATTATPVRVLRKISHPIATTRRMMSAIGMVPPTLFWTKVVKSVGMVPPGAGSTTSARPVSTMWTRG